MANNSAVTEGVPLVLKAIFGQALMWLGIAGAAITLFANLLAPLDMADWVWWIVQNWQDTTLVLWDLLSAWLRVEVPSLLVPPLNTAVLLLLTAIGVRIREHRRQELGVLNYPFYNFVVGMAALVAIGYMALTSQSQSSSGGEVPSSAPLAIFLAGSTISFSPAGAGGGNLIKRLWFILAGVGVLIALNELTKLGLDITAQKVSS